MTKLIKRGKALVSLSRLRCCDMAVANRRDPYLHATEMAFCVVPNQGGANPSRANTATEMTVFIIYSVIYPFYDFPILE